MSIGNTNMTFNLEGAGSANHGANESSQMSDISGGAGAADESNSNANQYGGPQQMILSGSGEEANNDFTKKIYKAKRFKPQP